MASSVFGQIPLPKLTKTNYDNWSIQMRALLGAQEAWDIVQTGYTAPEDEGEMTVAQIKDDKEKKKKDQAALYLMYQGVDESGFEKIAEAKTAKEAWDILASAYKGADRVKHVRLQTLRGELESMKMKDTEEVSSYITRIQTVTNQMKRNGEKLSDSRIVEKILRSLTNEFENVVCAIEESKDVDKLTIDELTGSLEAHEQRKKKKKMEALEESMKTKASMKDEKVLFSQSSKGRGHGNRGRNGNKKWTSRHW